MVAGQRVSSWTSVPNRSGCMPLAIRFNMADGKSTVSLFNEWGAGKEEGIIQVDFNGATLTGYLTLMGYLKRFIVQGVKVVSPSFPEPRKSCR